LRIKFSGRLTIDEDGKGNRGNTFHDGINVGVSPRGKWI
jgi:hypothetical protein